MSKIILCSIGNFRSSLDKPTYWFIDPDISINFCWLKNTPITINRLSQDIFAAHLLEFFNIYKSPRFPLYNTPSILWMKLWKNCARYFEWLPNGQKMSWTFPNLNLRDFVPVKYNECKIIFPNEDILNI